MSGLIRQVTITGLVQGVGYRAWVEHRARAHGLEGWVRNRRDGSVEALFVIPVGGVPLSAQVLADASTGMERHTAAATRPHKTEVRGARINIGMAPPDASSWSGRGGAGSLPARESLATR